MAIDFPNSPVTNDLYTVGGRTWKYDGEKWVVSSPVAGTVTVSTSSPTGGSDGDVWIVVAP